MSLFTWKPEYSVREATLDSHHQKLFSMLNTVYESVMKSSNVGCVMPMVEELSEYTSYHFSAEEQFMRGKNYCGIDSHISEHREFTKKIEELKTRYSGNDLEVTRDLIVVLGDWLLHHVIMVDRQYVEMTTRSKE